GTAPVPLAFRQSRHQLQSPRSSLTFPITGGKIRSSIAKELQNLRATNGTTAPVDLSVILICGNPYHQAGGTSFGITGCIALRGIIRGRRCPVTLSREWRYAREYSTWIRIRFQG